MKANRVRWLIAAGIALFAVYQVASVFLSGWLYFRDDRFGYDLRLRRNEVRCVQLGVDSFKIWDRETTLPGFTPLRRPDKADVPSAASDAVVHAYPPWHHAFFYFYGWLHEAMCLSLMSIVFGICLSFIVSETLRLSRARCDCGGLAAFFALSTLAFAATWCYCMLNYGILILAAFLLMNRALEKGHDVAAGLCWAVMMVKPQVGLLFVWPLFWHRRHRTILVAAAACALATLFVAGRVHESPVDLVLQIPKIGSPYGTSGFVKFLPASVFGESRTFVVMGAFFALTGLATWAFRKRGDFLLSCVPAALATPLWTYNKEHDAVILLPLFIVLACRAFASRKFGKWAWIACSYVLASVLFYGWIVLIDRGIVDHTKMQSLRAILRLLTFAPLAVFAALLVREDRLRPPAP
jgi:hypothetical protein